MDEFSLSSDLFLDIIFLVVIGISIGLGLFRGLVRELLSLLAWVLAGWMAYLYSGQLAEVLLRWLDAPRLSFLVSPVLVFLGTLVALSIMGRLVYQLFRIGGLTTMDRSFLQQYLLQHEQFLRAEQTQKSVRAVWLLPGAPRLLGRSYRSFQYR